MNPIVRSVKFLQIQLHIWLHIHFIDNFVVSVLAFADDIVLLAENAGDLQKLISIVQQWSSKWRFIINPEKSQVVHYRNAPKVRTNVEFTVTLQIDHQFRF